MKTWHWILLVVVALWTWRRTRRATTQEINAAYGASATSPERATAQAIADLTDVIMDGATVTGPADQAKYPGWWRASDGSWINVDTGAIISAGGSPPALRPTGPAINIDLSRQIDPSLATEPTGTIY